MTVRVRFAPSPTGRLHVGNARVALINWLFARQQGGQFCLRIDDTDTERSRAEYEVGIREDLNWLGLNWDRLDYQSRRGALYEQAAATLRAQGRLYPCYETAEELETRRRLQLARGKPPVYDRAALKLTDSDRAKLEAEGRQPHWRFRLEPGLVEWNDLSRGPCHYDTAHLSDPVLIRADGSWLYTLPSVVDDIEMGITHVLRGEDHATNSAVQIQIIQALGGVVPAFAHLPLMVDAQGQGLSKRLGSLSLADLRTQGTDPLAVCALLARLGSADPVVVCKTMEEIQAGFSLERLGRAAPRFDPAELEALNVRLLHQLPYAAVAWRLREAGIVADEALWMVVRSNLTRLEEMAHWSKVCRLTLTPVIEDAGLTSTAANLLPPEPWDGGTWGEWIRALQAATGVKGKALFRPLRLALTGRENGPELALLLLLMGRERVEARLRGETA